MRRYFVIALILAFMCAAAGQINASSVVDFEDSDPYLTLVVDKETVRPRETLHYTINYGNRGPTSAKDVKVTLNQALGGRSALEFVKSIPPPDEWIGSEYGRLPTFFVPELLPDAEATEGGEIEVNVKVRQSTPPQVLIATATLEAPKREFGKRLVTSEKVQTRIVVPFSDTALLGETATQSPEATESQLETYPIASLPTTAEQAPQSQAKEGSTSAIRSAIEFLFITALLLVAFIAGRKSKG